MNIISRSDVRRDTYLTCYVEIRRTEFKGEKGSGVWITGQVCANFCIGTSPAYTFDTLASCTSLQDADKGLRLDGLMLILPTDRNGPGRCIRGLFWRIYRIIWSI